MLATEAQLVYVAAMGLVASIATAAVARAPSAFVITQPGYRAQLLAPRRLALFAFALAAFVAVAPYTGDPTWDAVDATFMSIGCYLTAPWAMGVAYRALRGRASAVELAVAIAAWWIVASASYDAYLLFRDGAFPVTSNENAIASTVLYTLGGLFFSLGFDARRGLVFVFMHDDWPTWHGDRMPLRSAAGMTTLAIALATPVVVFLVWVVMDQLGMLR